MSGFAAGPGNAIPDSAGKPAGQTVLVVEDDQQVREFLEKVLRRGGYHVVSASSGRDALQRVREEAIDVVVTDLCMPQMDGIELVRHLRDVRRGIPVIAISGALVGYTGEMLNAVRLLGAQITLEKPFPPLRLIEAVKQLVGGGGETSAAS